MQIALIIYSLFCGLIFALTGFFFSVIMISPDKEVYHTKTFLSQRKNLIFFFFVETFAVFFIILQGSDEIELFKGLLTLYIMTMITFSDLIYGRIPLHYLIFSALTGIYFDFLQELSGFHVRGGLITFSMMLIIFLVGRHFYRRNSDSSIENSGFGLGDVYASGVLGFLFGLSKGIAAVIVCLTIAIGFAIVKSRLQKEVIFLKSRIRLGPFFLISTLFFVLIGFS